MKSLYPVNPMFFGDEKQVREVYKLCNPGAVARPPNWYFVHPTLVVVTDSIVVGFTSFTLTIIPGFGQTLYGMDMCVHPEYRGRGIAENLHKERLSVGHAAGARIFMGTTQNDNRAMVKILKKAGAHSCIPIGDDTLFVGPTKER